MVEENLQNQSNVEGVTFSACDDDENSKLHEDDDVAEVSLKGKRKLLQSNPNDQTALLSFKQSITMDPNGTLRDWNTSVNTDYCLWTGVICDTSTKRVIAINITGIICGPIMGNSNSAWVFGCCIGSESVLSSCESRTFKLQDSESKNRIWDVEVTRGQGEEWLST